MTNNWQKVRLNDVCIQITDGVHNTVIDTPNTQYYLLSCKNLKNGTIVIRENERTISEETLLTLRKRTQTAKGDVLLSSVGTIGETAIIKDENPNYEFQRSVAIFKPNPDCITSKFLFYVLNNNKKILQHAAHGAVQQCLFINPLKDFEIQLPPLDVQRRIAGVLGALDDKIELNNKINNNLEQQALSLLLNYIENTNEKVPLKKVISFVNGFAFKSQDYLNSGKYKVITIKNVQDGKVDSLGTSFINDLPTKLSSECCLNIGDVLLSLTGNVGRVGIVTENNLLLNQRVAKIQPIKEDILPFIYFYLRLPSFKNEMENISKGTAQQNLSPVETLKLEISYDKNNISNISKTLKTFYDEIIFNDMQNRTLSSIRDALLPKLMSGEIDVENLPPSAIIPNE